MSDTPSDRGTALPEHGIGRDEVTRLLDEVARDDVTDWEERLMAGGTYPALIWKSFVEKALKYEDEPPETFPSPVYQSTEARDVVYRNNQWLLDNGNCRDVRLVTYVVGSAPTKEAPCKPNEVDVPPVVGAMMMFKGHWTGKGVFNVEQLPSKPFMDEIGKQGLPWHIVDINPADQAELFAVKT